MESSATLTSSRPLESRRWIHVLEWILFAALAVQFCIRTLPNSWLRLNTDFPNYYLTARLVREHYDTSRIYEWQWIERQKDHRSIDQRVVGMVPITPFSTLAVYPLAHLPPLKAKRYWIVINLVLLLAALYLLRVITELSWRRLLLIAALSMPLRVNLTYGQYYVLLLLFLTLAYWLYTRSASFLSGAAVGLAAGLKVFPVLYLLYFVRKKDWKAFGGGIAGVLFSGVVSLLVFGWQLNRTYLFQVLPATFRGEALDPYDLDLGSIASLLHRLFIYEPQSNPHPALHAAWLFAVGHPLLQMAILAPALLLVVPADIRPRQIHLEWAAIILASLAMSTSPADYLFTVLILPVCLLLTALPDKNHGLWTTALLALYTAMGYLHAANHAANGWSALVQMPRLYATILLLGIVCTFLLGQRNIEAADRDRRTRTLWASALALIVAFNITAGLHHQHELYDSYRWRVALPEQVLVASNPVVQNNTIYFIAMWGSGYRHAIIGDDGIRVSPESPYDFFSPAIAGDNLWLERAGAQSSVISTSSTSSIKQAGSPLASPDGKWLAFLREGRGRDRIWLRTLAQRSDADKVLTAPQLNVFEMSFAPTGDIIFSAASDSQPELYVVNQAGTAQPLNIFSARYPAVSPDGHWLAYSQLTRGNWHLLLRNLDDGQTRRLSNAACNDIEPTWTADSKTLIYSSDCGRALWFTSLVKRRIFP